MFGKAVAHALCKGCEQMKFCLVGDLKKEKESGDLSGT